MTTKLWTYAARGKLIPRGALKRLTPAQRRWVKRQYTRRQRAAGKWEVRYADAQ